MYTEESKIPWEDTAKCENENIFKIERRERGRVRV